MINTSLYRLTHGNLDDVQADVEKLENYFQNRREQVAQITLTPNFGIDYDMTSMVEMIFPEFRTQKIKIYKRPWKMLFSERKMTL